MTLAGAWVTPASLIEEFGQWLVVPGSGTATRAVFVPGAYPGFGDYDHPFGAGIESPLGGTLNAIGWYPNLAYPQNAAWNNGNLDRFDFAIWDDTLTYQWPISDAGLYDDDGNPLDPRFSWARDPASLVPPASSVEYEASLGGVSPGAVDSSKDAVVVDHWAFRLTGAFTGKNSVPDGKSALYVVTDGFGKTTTMPGYPIDDPDDAQYDAVTYQVWKVDALDATLPSGQDYQSTAAYGPDPVQQYAYDANAIALTATASKPGYYIHWTIDWGDGHTNTGDNYSPGSPYSDINLNTSHDYSASPVGSYTVTFTAEWRDTDNTFYPLASQTGTVILHTLGLPTAGPSSFLNVAAANTPQPGWIHEAGGAPAWFAAIASTGVLQAEILLRNDSSHQDFELAQPAADGGGQHWVNLAGCPDWAVRAPEVMPTFPDWTRTSVCDDTPDTIYTTGPRCALPRLLCRPVYRPARWRRTYNFPTLSVSPERPYARFACDLQIVPEWQGVETLAGIVWHIDWGDGATSQTTSLVVSHTYAEAGSHYINVQGVGGSESGANVGRSTETSSVFVQVLDSPDLAGDGGLHTPGFYGRRR